MDHKLACMAFKPPPPLSMAAYFDQVTQGGLKHDGYLSMFQLDKVLDRIEARPSLTEQAALMAELEDRYIAYARPHGWLKTPETTEAKTAGLVTDFIVKDVLGIKGESATDKAKGELTDLLKELVKSSLNDRGKKSLKLMQTILSLCEAKTGEEVIRVLGAAGLDKLSAWLKLELNRKAMLQLLKRVGVSSRTRYHVIKVIAVRLAWLEVKIARMAPIITALELLLTPEPIADDATEWRLTFLAAYARLFTRRTAQSGRLVQACGGAEWRLRVPVPEALNSAILRMH